MVNRSVVAALALFVLLFLMMADAASAPAGLQPIAADPNADEEEADISGDRIVYMSDRNGNRHDIYLYDLTTRSAKPVCANPGERRWPRIDGRRVFWVDWHHEWPLVVQMHDLHSGLQAPVTLQPDSGDWPSVSGDRIVWPGDGQEGVGIYLLDLETGVRRKIADGIYPDMSGDKVVYWRKGVYMHDLSSATEVLICKTDAFCMPRISGNLIVWHAQAAPGDCRVSIHDLGTGVTRDIGTGMWPDIDGDQVVWLAGDIVLYDTASEVRRKLTSDGLPKFSVRIDGGRIVWTQQQADGTGHQDVWLYDLRAPDTEAAPSTADFGEVPAHLRTTPW